MTHLFTYPQDAHVRRHAPMGYADYLSFRPWLRDEFTFRCVYCLRRESLGQQFGEFAVDHFLPIKFRPHLELEYQNLLYVCMRCNLRKMDQFVADPLVHLLSQHVVVYADGRIEAHTRQSQQIVRVLKLNEEKLILNRKMWIEILGLSATHEPELYRRILGFPEDLPDLSTLRPPGGNTQPDGVTKSYFARRERGELPEMY